MYAKIFVLLLGVCYCAADLPPYLGANVKLLELMSTQMAMGRSAGSMECFQYYVPILNNITATYETQYKVCDSRASADRWIVDNDTYAQRKKIDATAEQACSRLQTCSQKNESQAYFECYVKAGTENSVVMYQISNDASDVLTDVNERYRLIEITEDSCKKAAERTYVEDTVNTNNDLNSCLAGEGIRSTTANTPEPTNGL